MRRTLQVFAFYKDAVIQNKNALFHVKPNPCPKAPLLNRGDSLTTAVTLDRVAIMSLNKSNTRRAAGSGIQSPPPVKRWVLISAWARAGVRNILRILPFGRRIEAKIRQKYNFKTNFGGIVFNGEFFQDLIAYLYFEKKKDGFYKVKTATFDELMSRYPSITHIDFISIDVEGHELSVLETIDFNRFSFGLFTIEDNAGETVIEDFMKTKGYRVFMRTGGDVMFERDQ